MPSNIAIITSRRAYEYGPDQLRLSTIVTAPVADTLQQMFQFEVKKVGSPMPTFGPISATLPPGLVLDYGSLALKDGALAAIRFVHFEAQRIVIDVAGPSPIIDEVFSRIEALLKQVQTPDGRPVLGELATVKDYSELNATLRFSQESLVPFSLPISVYKSLVGERNNAEYVVVPVLEIRVQPPHEEYPGTSTDEPYLRLELRAGTTPDARTYFSVAPVTSDAHIALLEAIENTLA
jgi:hypothetical protein